MEDRGKAKDYDRFDVNCWGVKMKSPLEHRTMPGGKRYLVVGQALSRSDMTELRNKYRVALNRKFPKHEIRIEPRSKPGQRDTWELLVEVKV